MDLIPVKDTRYEEYETLLIHRDVLRKDAEQYLLSWIREFGDLINDVFAKKIECISLKKKIAWCQARINRGMPLNPQELDSYIEDVMRVYYGQLNDMIKDTENAKKTKDIPLFKVRKIKEIYRFLAKKIHPDMRPDLAQDETVRELWNAVVNAYTYNRLEELEELKFRTEAFLAAKGDEDIRIEIECLDEKIASLHDEIDRILSTNPYLYRFILNDPQEMEEKREELTDELQSYTDYALELDEVLNTFDLSQRRVS